MAEFLQPAVDFRDVHYSIGDTPILKGVTGSFPDGKITTVVGPSGAGKSTLLKLCNGLISPDRGTIFIQETPIDRISPIRLRQIVGIALQDAPMIEGTVADNLAVPRKLKGEDLTAEEAETALADVGLLRDFLNRNSQELSGGQRQKVSIARTLVNRPDILLLDEITSSLDRTSQREIEELIRAINRKFGVTIIWITHNLDQALRIGDYTWVMMDGEVAESGEHVLEYPAAQRVQQFLKGGRA
ncbi:ABC transporter ATP-binding protein [Planococcus lenghuensis]|uniref:Phosphate ABC transporter ATP-binding protein n=1 Tax=Planococcus lenghuensis TaxID=2213202 RepID=A0A1Q2L3J5_9BACL|nr:phosphate ABC transporter ATP-binding protein [Planococcus lenghuensis]AQQ54944.1 phosphate ABC transporter ATP-binding protein [Planococcus lenghuensis]